MKLEELFEAKDQYSASEVKKNIPQIVKLLKTKCSEMVKAYASGHGYLFRGIKELNMKDRPMFIHSNIRTDRNPVEMNRVHHELICDAMDKLKIPTRRNSLFCTTDSDIANSWGHPYIIFVEDGWEGLVFDGIDKDDYAYGTIAGAAFRATLKIPPRKGEERKEVTRDDQVEKLAGYIQDMEPKTFKSATDLTEIISNHYIDILIKGKGYYALDSHNLEILKVLDELGIDLSNT